MLKITQKLNPKLFDADCEQIPIRKGFGEGLHSLRLFGIILP